jgi:O-acetyl-ADP-ribose deacetylase (regulator of RNase III)
MKEIKFLLQDITKNTSQAIVNAANEDLRGGGGVDGAIHMVAGPKLDEECKTLGGCLPGEAKITKGYRLSAKYIIHTVGPRYYSSPNPSKTLYSCYQNCLRLADAYKITSIAFPSISTGVFAYPLNEAAQIAITSIEDYFVSTSSHIKTISFCFISSVDQSAYQEAYTIFTKTHIGRQ